MSHSAKTLLLWGILLSVVAGRVYQFPLQASTQRTLAIGWAAQTHQNGTHVKNAFQMHYVTNVSVGTPPQIFPVSLQTGPVLPLVIPSVNCAHAHGCDGRPSNRFNSSTSSTYTPGSLQLSQQFNNVIYQGPSSKDMVTVGGVTVPELEFLEWTEREIIGLTLFDSEYDGIVGLTPPWYQSSKEGHISESLLATLDKHGELDAKMFSLDLNTTYNGTGTLKIGAKDNLMDHVDTVKIPIVESSEVGLSGLWTSTIKSMTIEYNFQPPAELPFPGDYTVLFDLGNFRTTIPRTYGLEFLKLTGARRMGWMNAIGCSDIDSLPNLLFTFGNNQKVRITPRDYVAEVVLLAEPRFVLCSVAVDDTSEHNDISDNTLVLGSTFLRAFHSIWDWENKQIGFAPKVSNESK